MPLKHDWTFVCDTCSRVIAQDQDPYDGGYRDELDCCGSHMRRVFEDHKMFYINGAAYMRTKYSDALAISPSQIAEHKRMFPDIAVSSEGQIGFTDVAQQDKYLDTCGFVKHPQSIRKLKGETIAKM